MPVERLFECPVCGTEVRTTDPRKRYCTKQCADRSRNLGPVAPSDVTELKSFSRLTSAQKEAVLMGQAGLSVVMFDIEATHLKPNVGRILCCSFKPLGGDVYTFTAHDSEYMKRDVYDDSALAIAIRDELEKYDIIVGWNSKNFDAKFINSRVMRGGGRVKVAQYHVDGMWSWRSKVSAWSKLDTAQRFIFPEAETHKTSVSWEEWMRALGWDTALRTAAMDNIVEHCEIDVTVLEDVYVRMVQAGVIRSLRKDGGVL